MAHKQRRAGEMKRYDMIVVGAGPAGLSAAIESAKRGMKVCVFDENDRPGGQLFKQIHKFFGSKEHKAKIRGINIGKELLDEATRFGVEVKLNCVVAGVFYPLKITVHENDHITAYSADNILIATGASENMIPYDGWTLPGVIGAGAAQTMMNLHGVKPGQKILMVGSGNVGLVVSYQLMQAGCEVAAVIDAASRVGGYGVHASKIARAGIPFYTSYTILKAEGADHVEGVVIAQVDSKWNPIPGTEKHFDVDTICMAVGLSPMSQLTRMAGCKMVDRGGLVPVCDAFGQTSVEGLFAAGDVAGIEEASSAMIGGRIAALSAARRSGFIEEADFEKEYPYLKESLHKLHKGLFAPCNRGRTDIVKTDEGIELSQSLFQKGYIAEDEIMKYPGAIKSGKKGIRPVIECIQNIPCNPCQDACRFGCIKVGEDITRLPEVNPDIECKNCGMCVAACSGQAIFLVNEDYALGYATVTLPYEFFPIPKIGEKGNGLDRSGKAVCDAEVVDVKASKVFDHTVLLTIKVPVDMAMKARFYKKN